MVAGPEGAAAEVDVGAHHGVSHGANSDTPSDPAQPGPDPRPTEVVGAVIANLHIVILRGALLAALAVVLSVPPAGAVGTDPPWSVDEQQLADALECPDTFAHPDREPVLLVHGTFTAGREQYGWNYALLLPERGFDVCLVTYPDRGLGDLQVSAEYVAHAILEVHERTGRMVDVMGHSQGGLLPRWAITFWPSVRAVVDDAVLVAPPSHGTDVAASGDGSPFAMPAAFFQMGPSSRFIGALNAGDETPGEVSWSVLYTEDDELVRPVDPVPTAALDWGHEPANVRNVRIQDLCPGRLVDHLTIGTTDRLSQELVLDAFANPGPVDPARLGPLSALCTLPDQYVTPAQLPTMLEQLAASMQGGSPDFHSTETEPSLKPYAEAALAAPPASSASSGSAAEGEEPGASEGASGSSPSATVGSARLPATGTSVPTTPAAVLLLAALTLHRLRARS